MYFKFLKKNRGAKNNLKYCRLTRRLVLNISKKMKKIGFVVLEKVEVANWLTYTVYNYQLNSKFYYKYILDFMNKCI